MSMLTLHKVRDLTLGQGVTPHRPAYVSAASGLVQVGSHLYLVADDELHLAMFAADGQQPGELLRLFPGELPDEPKQRKKHKPDLEILMPVPATTRYPHGALLALGSGSRRRRCLGALLSLNELGRVDQPPVIIDAAPLFALLKHELDELNLEGAWISGPQFNLLQRGNKGGPNAVVQLSWPAVSTGLFNEQVLPETKIHIQKMPLGEVQGVPLCFSDATALADGRWLFSAVAEDTDNAVDDGAFMGAAIGIADGRNQIQWLKLVAPPRKIEGVACEQRGDRVRMLMVTDADDPSQPAELLVADVGV